LLKSGAGAYAVDSSARSHSRQAKLADSVENDPMRHWRSDIAVPHNQTPQHPGHSRFPFTVASGVQLGGAWVCDSYPKPTAEISITKYPGESDMKRILAATAAIAALIGPAALAADMPAKAPPPPPTSGCTWCGFYIGANGGWGWSHVTASEAPFGVEAISQISPQSLGTGLNGGVFGGQIGYNWQTANWVAGIEGDFDGASINGVNQVIFPNILFSRFGINSGFAAEENVGWLASIRGRLGTTWGSGLAYITGGAAWERVTTTAMINADTLPGSFNQTGTSRFSTTQSGFVVGAGYEWMIAPKWTVRAEYLFYDFNRGSTNALTMTGACASPPTCGVNVTTGHNNISVARLGVNYLFNSAPGDVATSPVNLPSKAPHLALSPSWAGFYIGANGGWGWSHVTASENNPFGPDAIADISPQSLGTGLNGGVFGGQIGYNWQAGNWVVGIEGDIDGASINGVNQLIFPAGALSPPGVTNGFMARENVGWLASIRGRLGTTWGSGLAYITGGAAWERVTTAAWISADTGALVDSQSGTGRFSTTQPGFVVGAGYEWMIAPKWTVRAEYLFYDFNRGSTNALTMTGVCNSTPTCGVNVTTGHNNISVARLGMSYMFNSIR
jgi:outer membrane immunogenic protein